MPVLFSDACTSTHVRADASMPEFRFPDWRAPIDLADRVRRAPAEHTVKGMFFQQALEAACSATGEARAPSRYAPFEDYPLRDWLGLLVRAAEVAYPGEPVREGLRRIGRRAREAFASSVIGNVLLSPVDHDVSARLRLAPRIYRMMGRGGSVDASFPTPTRALLHLRDVWDFPDAYHVGIFESVLCALGISGQVRVRVLGQASADIEVSWI